MRHQTTKTLYNYWQDLRGDRLAPERSEVDPSHIRHILGETFILECTEEGSYHFRLAGTRICSTYCREMKGRNFIDLWHKKDQEPLTHLLRSMCKDATGLIINFEGLNRRGITLSSELLLLPLTNRNEGFSRIVGTQSNIDTPYWLGLHPIEKQYIINTRLIRPDEQEHIFQQAIANSLNGTPTASYVTTQQPLRRRAHLTVYDGGRSS